MVSLQKITKNGRALFLAYDQGLEHGPVDLNDKSAMPEYIFNLGVMGKFTAVIVHKGIAEKYYHPYQFKVPLIIKLNGKTSLSQSAPFSAQLCGVDEAIALGAVAVGYTVYLGSPREDEMLGTFANIVAQAHARKIPVIAWMYPRGEHIDEADPNLQAYAARVGAELGADIVKIKYPGTIEKLAWAVHCAGKTLVVCSGGSKTAYEKIIEEAMAIRAAGAAGFAIGRNIWQQENPLEIASKLHGIIL